MSTCDFTIGGKSTSHQEHTEGAPTPPRRPPMVAQGPHAPGGRASHVPAEDRAPELPGGDGGSLKAATPAPPRPPPHAQAGRRPVGVLQAGPVVLAAPRGLSSEPGTPGRRGGPQGTTPGSGQHAGHVGESEAQPRLAAGHPPADDMLISMHHWACQVPRPWRPGPRGKDTCARPLRRACINIHRAGAVITASD